MAAFAASNSWPPPSQFLLYVTVNFMLLLLDSDADADDDDDDDALLEELLPLLAGSYTTLFEEVLFVEELLLMKKVL